MPRLILGCVRPPPAPLFPRLRRDLATLEQDSDISAYRPHDREDIARISSTPHLKHLSDPRVRNGRIGIWAALGLRHESIAEKMVICAAAFPKGESEISVARLSLAKSEKIDVDYIGVRWCRWSVAA